LYLLLGLVYLPVAVYQALFLGKNRRGWRQRFGRIPRRDPARERIWIHAVSLGEINATPKLAAVLRERLPDCELVFSSTTDTGTARAVQLYGAANVFRFPLDFSRVVGRTLRRLAPRMIVLVELEVWPNLVAAAKRRGIPVVVVNGRLTEKSAGRLGRLGRVIRATFAHLAWVGAQDEPIADRFRKVGVRPDRLQITSSLKWDSAEISEGIAGAVELAQALGIDPNDRLWVCGSTGPGEESLILEAYQAVRSAMGESSPRLCVIPRKPERFDEAAGLIERAGFHCVRRGRRPDGTLADATPEGAVILGDTMGELRKFYSLATVVFVGRSLVPLGGSDPMEVAALGKPIVVGPYMENFQEALAAFRSAQAVVTVSDTHSLAQAVQRLLMDLPAARSMGSKAQDVVRVRQGATLRTAEAILNVWNRSKRLRQGDPRRS
jgi:3-deoxy-D-manno-octulosonic-acid transferase